MAPSGFKIRANSLLIIVASDCSLHNIMLEARAPPASIRSPPSPLKQASRTLLQVVRGASNNFTASRATYYFVGFRGAIACSPDYKFCTDSKNFTTDKEPPEFWHEYLTFYDPLLLDVFLIGNMLRREFLDVSHMILNRQTP